MGSWKHHYVPPPVLQAPAKNVVQREFARKAKDVFFKLITTGNKYYQHEIIVISAASIDDQREFLTCVLPKDPAEQSIVTKADKLLGPHIKLCNGNYCMYINETMVQTVSLTEAMGSFVQFLKEVASSDGKVNLTGDNCVNHDAYFLNEALTETGYLREYESVVSFYTDTSYLFKEAWQTITQDKRGPKCLTTDVLLRTCEEFDYVEEVKALGELVYTARGSYLYVNAGTYEYGAIKEFISYTKFRHDLEDTLEPLFKTIRPVVISQVMAKKMTATGICFDHLKEAYQHSEPEALRQLLTQNVDGKARVTTCDMTLDKLYDFFFLNHIAEE